MQVNSDWIYGFEGYPVNCLETGRVLQTVENPSEGKTSHLMKENLISFKLIETNRLVFRILICLKVLERNQLEAVQ